MKRDSVIYAHLNHGERMTKDIANIGLFAKFVDGTWFQIWIFVANNENMGGKSNAKRF